mgnify:CR=1 FL=1
MDNKRPLIAHLCILMACVFWGLMSPIGKIAMQNGIDNIDLVYFRAAHAQGFLARDWLLEDKG